MTPISLSDRQSAIAAIRALNDSPLQRRFREQKPWFVGVVYWNPADCDKTKLLYEFERIKGLGFNVLRFHSVEPMEIAPGEFDFSRSDLWMDVAAEVDLGVLLGMHTRPSSATLALHGLTVEEFAASQPADPRALAAIRATIAPMIQRYCQHPALFGWMGFGEPGPGPRSMDNPGDRQAFAGWLRDKYGSLEAVDRAWNIYPRAGQLILNAFEDAWRLGMWLPPEGAQAGLYPTLLRNYGARRDLMRFQTEQMLTRMRATIQIAKEIDPEHLIETGSHQVFSNQAHLRWDIGQWARAADLHTISIHLSWHFELAEGEIDRPVYMHARLVRDYFKDGWTSAFETTGGAVQYSGGYGNAITPGLMRRFMLNYLAAGNLSLAFWTWDHRPGGWEAGEYGLTTLSGAVSNWAQEAGCVARAFARCAGELWDADNETQVAILQNWDTDAIYELEPERHELRHAGPNDYTTGTRQQPGRARIGAARAMLNQGVPFEYVTEDELLAGIGLAYPAIYAPHLRSISDELLAALLAYVEKGGRLIADVQFAFEDSWGKLRATGPGGWQERLFGAYIDTIHDARTNRLRLNAFDVHGFYGDVQVTRARVLASFDDGMPAVTEVQIGQGSAVLVGFDAGMMCHRPGCEPVEQLLAALAWGDNRRSWECSAPIAFRRSAPTADHYFLINDGPARTAWLKVFDRVYRHGEDLITGRAITCAGSPSQIVAVELPAESAMWVRMEKTGA